MLNHSMTIGQKGKMMTTLKTNAEVNSIVESEGFDYAIMYYLDGNKILDPKLKELWLNAYNILHEIDSILSEEVPF